MGYSVVYDGDCSFCVNAMERVRRWDKHGRLTFVPFSDPKAKELLTSVDWSTFFGSFHLVGPDGKHWSGAEAVPELLELLPKGKAPAWVLKHVPGAARVNGWIYRWISHNRHKMGGKPYVG